MSSRIHWALMLALLVSDSSAVDSLSAQQSKKVQPPTKADAASAAQQLRTRYAAQLRTARTYQQRADFAGVLIGDSKNEGSSTLKYALLRMAGQQAVSARSPERAMQAIAEIDLAFEVDAHALRVDAIRSIVDSVKSNDHRRSAIDAAIKLVNESIESRQLDGVLPVAESLPRIAKRLRDEPRRIEAEKLVARAKQALLQRERTAAAAKRVAAAPNDADANYTLAMSNFNSGQWNDGIRQLAKAALHPDLARLAQRDLQGANAKDKFIGLAEAWTKASAQQRELGVLRGRALYWMHRAIPKTQGDERKNLEEQARALTTELKTWKAEQERLASYEPKYGAQQQPNAQGANGSAATAEAEANPPAPIACEVEHRFDAHRGPANDVCFHPKHPWLATCGDDGAIHIWNLSSRQREMTLEGHEGAVYGIAFSPDGRRLASVGADKSLRIWKLPSPGRTAGKIPDPVVLQGHATRIRDVVFAHSGSYLITCADDHRVGFWDVKSARSVVREEHKGIVYAVAASPMEYTAASVGEQGRVQVWNRLAPSAGWVGHGGKATAVAFSPAGKTLATGGEDRKILLWDMKSGNKVTLSNEPASINSVAFARKRPLLASASRDRTVKLWQQDERRQLAICQGLENEALALAFSADDATLAAASRSGKVTLWRVPASD